MASASLWRAILAPDGPLPAQWNSEMPVEDVQRFADLVTPALAAYSLAAAESHMGRAFLDAETVRKSRLINRFNGGVQRRWMAAISETGIPVVYLKGFALAHSLYPDPDIRTIGDLDILVRPEGLDSLLAFLSDKGFAFDPLPMAPWGFISDASFMPMVSPEGDCSIDIHVQPDCYPAYRSLTVEDVFAHSAVQTIADRPVNIPCTEHSMLLCLTNAAKDKFGIFSVRKLVDIAMLLRPGVPVDWDMVERLAVSGHFLQPARAVFALLRRLGLPAGVVPESLCRAPSVLAARPFERLVSDYVSMFATAPTTMRTLERELTLCTEPGVALHNAGLRLKGLIRRRKGIPPDYYLS
jgi:hypothetical protein